MKNYSALTVRYLKKHPGRTVLTLIGIIVSIAMFTAIGSIYYSGINSEIERVKDETGNYEIMFYDADREQARVLSANAEIKNGGLVKEQGSFLIESSLLTDSLRKVNIKAYDSAAFKDIFRVRLVEGRFPENSSEIVVDKKFYAVLKDKKLDKALEGRLKSKQGVEDRAEYKVVGSYESQEITNTALSFLDIGSSDNTKTYSYFVNLKQASGKPELAVKIAQANKVKANGNTRLLYLIGDGPDETRNNQMEVVFGIIAAFVVICTAVVIYNAFNISVMERIKHFGILRSIGATKAQIRKLVFKEALVMSAISIPIGIICGFAGIMLTFNVFMDGFLGVFKIGFYPQVIAIAALLGLVTVFFSAFFPARTASRVSPIDAIRGTMVVKGDRVKRRGGFLAKLFFRFEGQVAYKNIKRSRKRFYVTCLSLMISLVMYVFFSNFIDILFESTELASGMIRVEAAFMKQQKAGSPYLSDELAKQLESTEGVREVFELNYCKIPFLLDKDKVSNKFRESLKLKGTQEFQGQYIIDETQLIGYDRNSVELLNKLNSTNINYDDFNNNHGVIIVNKAGGLTENKKRFYDGFTTYKKGDVIQVPVLDEAFITGQDYDRLKRLAGGKETMTLKVAGVIDYESISGSVIYDGYGMIVSSENFTGLTGIKGLSIIAANFTSPEAAGKNYEKFNILADENKADYTDIGHEKEKVDAVAGQMKVLVYGFIGLIIVISTVNIINTVTINLLVKKREYATFKAIGMTKGQFRKLVLLEGALFGMIACIAGLPVAYLLTYFGILQNNPVGNIGYSMAIWPYLYGGIGIIAITLAAAVIPLRKLNDMNIVESLRIEE
ncbi:macrolide export ATP-binding/permease protein MacB [Ruminiclostridium hungatei]|uniref:Macrolide export ATP-binding/permease protein MacB n=1 Tax=Ruminiclostridium hungatei TaxID=48256 RepID=A0A1V4SKD9_RUMHU|nr:ABC transporter permease [Ruminiclostridium hungatei]OPX44369.1 macrolide export ATP-binding/permease protein MacB [Ruminiclostridium hungatei]